MGIDLTQWDDVYEETQIDEPRDYDVAPDGRYQVVVDDVDLVESKSGTPMLAWKLKVVSGKYQGRMFYKNSVIKTPSNVKFLKSDLAVCGIELPKLSDLPNNLYRICGIGLEINVKTKDENRNVYFSKRITLPETGPQLDDDDGLAF